jgi:subtilisin
MNKFDFSKISRVQCLRFVSLISFFLCIFPLLPLNGQPPERVDVIIGLKSSVTPSDEAMVRGAGGEIQHSFWIIDAMAISVPESALQGLANHPRVERVTYDPRVQVVLGETVPWGIDRVFGNDKQERQAVWITSNRGEGVKVAVLDTGIDPNHPDLEIAGGWNFVPDRGTFPLPNEHWHDLHGHGTHVAGTIAAKENGLGVVGVVPDVALYAIRVADDDGFAQTAHIIAGIQEAVAQNVHIINMSLGNLAYSWQMEDAVNNAYDLHNVLVVAAAGNDGQQNSVHYPAAYDGAIAVAAASLTKDGIQRAYYSDRGPEVELIAPGTGVLSTVPNEELDEPFWEQDNQTPGTGQTGGPLVVPSVKKYAYMSGTSMAVPHVTGVAALVWSQNPALSNHEVRDILNDTAEDLGRPAYEQGAGLVRADRAVAGERFTAMPVSAARVFRQLGHNSQHHAITARYVDEEGDPVENVVVTFEVIDGPNEGEQTSSWSPPETDSHGEATWSYFGTGGGGVDTILVTFVLDPQASPPETVELEVSCHWIIDWELIELDTPEGHQGPLMARTLNTVEDGSGGWSAAIAAQDAQGDALVLDEFDYLNLLPPPEESADRIYLHSINSVPDNVLAVGNTDSSPVRAWYWLPDHIEATELPFLSEQDPDMWGARAKAANNKGWISGYSSNQHGDLHAVVWWPDFEFDLSGGDHMYHDTPIDLGYFSGPTVQASRAEAINENGVVVGAGKNSLGRWRAFRSNSTDAVPSGWNDMGTATGFSTHESLAFDINNHGALVGASQVSSPSGAWRAMYKRPNTGMNSGWVDLGVLPGSIHASEARAINDNGLIVGYSMWPSRAFVTATPGDYSLWTNAQPMYDLNDYTRVWTGTGYESLTASDWTLVEARSINSRNWILAIAELEGRATPRAVLLKPRYD